MIRELSGHDPTRFGAILEVPVRDGLEAYLARLRDRAWQAYQHECLLYVQGGLKKKPKLPEIIA